MNFPEHYFEEETREGFTISEMMKRAWGAQLELLNEITRVCRENDIPFFAEYGTLLGAVRHKGFIPWDDDLDIGMKREDYNRFLRIAPTAFDPEYVFLSAEYEPDYHEDIGRLLNGHSIDTGAARMEKFHGCPYAVGIDIFPQDYIPRDPVEFQDWTNMIGLVYDLKQAVLAPLPEPGPEFTALQQMVYKRKISDAISRVQELTGVTFLPEEEAPLHWQLQLLQNQLCQKYDREDADHIGTALRQLRFREHYYVPVDTYDTLIELPFELEGFTVPAPKDYDAVLTMRYGANYMTPKQYINHDYPFYKDQEEILKRAMNQQ